MSALLGVRVRARAAPRLPVLALALALTVATPLSAQAVCDAGPAPDLALCALPGAGASETQALQRLACLLGALNRWKMQVIACLQARIDGWQASVMWPVEGLREIGTPLRRMATLREELEAMARTGWHLDPWQQALAEIGTQPSRVDRGLYESAWGPSTGVGRDLQDVVAWHSAHTRNVLQARTNGSFGQAGELPESTWERIGREGPALVDQERDALSALRLTPQMIADRVRVEASTTRLQAQALVTAQLQRDLRRWRQQRSQHLGTLMLATLTSDRRSAGGARGRP